MADRALLQQALDALEWLLANIRRNAPELSGKAMGNAEVAIAALREALAAPEPAAWKHDCAALCTNDVELWIDACPHCGKPRTAPPTAPAEDHATPSGGQEAGPQEDRIEAAYWRFDARHKGYSQWKSAPMSERDAFKAEMRNALEAEKVRAEMRLVARGWLRPDTPAAPAPAAPVVPLTDKQILSMWRSSKFRGNGGQADWFCEGIRAAEAHHGITGGKP